jgi:hypothetical protein
VSERVRACAAAVRSDALAADDVHVLYLRYDGKEFTMRPPWPHHPTPF